MSTTITRRPRLQGTYSQWVAGGMYSKLTALIDDSDSTYVAVNTGPTDRDTWFFNALGIPDDSVIATVEVEDRQNGDSTDSSGLMSILAGTEVVSPTFLYSGSWPTFQNNKWIVPRPGGGFWTVADIDAAEFGLNGHNWSVHATPGCFELYLHVTYATAGELLEQVRDLGARWVQRYGSMPDKLAIMVAAAFLGLRPGQVLSIAHKLIPTAEGTGRSSEQWDRLVGRIFEREIDLDNLAAGVTLRFDDMRGILRRYRDGGLSAKEPGGTRDGALILSPGGLRTYNGAPALVDSPVSGLLLQVASVVEPVGARGRLHEGQGQNTVLNSAFILGSTSWTLAGGAAIVSTTEAFDPTVSTQHLNLAFSGFGTSGQQAGIVAAAGWVNLSVIHRELTASSVTRIRIQRASDGWYLNQALAWQATATDIDLPYRSVYTRDVIGPIDQTGGATTYTVTLKTTVTGHDADVAHSQVEPAQNGKGWASSPIITTTAAVIRAANSLLEDNGSANRKIRAARGCYRGIVDPLFNSADVATGIADHYLWAVTHDANNWMRLYYAVSTSAGVFERRAGGTTKTVSFPVALIRGVRQPFIVTWQSTGGENGDAPYTISISLGGLERITATSGELTEQASSNWWRGSLDGATGHLNGFLFDEEVLDFVPTPAENRKWARGRS